MQLLGIVLIAFLSCTMTVAWFISIRVTNHNIRCNSNYKYLLGHNNSNTYDQNCSQEMQHYNNFKYNINKYNKY